MLALTLALTSGCRKQAPPPQTTEKQEIKLHPVRPPSDQPMAPYPPLPESPPTEQEKFEKAVQAYFEAKLKREGAEQSCLPGRELVDLEGQINGDLDGDGRDEVFVSAFSCMAGNAGPDLTAVFKVGPDNELTEMPFAPKDPKAKFPRTNPAADVSYPATRIENGRLIFEQGIYRPGDPKCCPTGGTRSSMYRWNGNALVLEDIVDSPPLDRSIEDRKRAHLDSAMEKVFLRGSMAKSVEEVCAQQGIHNSGLTDGQILYGDLDGDGKEEAVMTAYSCFAGNAGPDLFAVFRLEADGKVTELEFEPRNSDEPFKGQRVSDGVRGRATITIEKGRLIFEYNVYRKGDANCCPSLGRRRFIYHWDGSKLALESVINVPAKSAE